MTATLPATGSSGTPDEIDAAVARRLDAAISEVISTANVPGVVIGIWGPDGRYVRAFGVADKVTDAPMEVGFHHRIGSVTKTFTVTAVLQLVDTGRLKLDDPIAGYVDGVPRGEEITLRHLASMQSGLPNYSVTSDFHRVLYGDPLRAFTPRELLDHAFTEPGDFAPGEDFGYSNTNAILLGMTVEKMSGRSLPDYVHDEILAPLALSHTSFPTDNAYPAPHAQGYALNAQGTESAATNWNPSWSWAAGAMISTLADMHVWAEALATGTLLSAATQRQRLETHGDADMAPQDVYGLGLFDLAGWVGHNGSLPGYQTVAVHLAATQTTLVIMTNTDIPADGATPSTSLATAITKIVSPEHVYTLG